jgi:CubicO group peptidase (beta-lactamase class C family)
VRNRPSLFLWAALAFPLGSALADLHAQESASPRFSDELVKTLDAEVARQMEKKHLPGVVVAIRVPAEGNYIAVEGKANLENGRARQRDDPFRIASITKTFVATAILQLVDRGKLRKSDTIDNWYPDFPNAEPAGGAGAIVSTVTDLEIFARALYRGDVLKPQTQRARMQFNPISGAPAWVQYGEDIGKFGRFYGHNGAIWGFSSDMFYLPEKDATVVISVNRNDEDEYSQADPLFFALTKILFPSFAEW